MCGIVSIAYGEDNPDIGKEAAALLRRLEYRGYDSTGASFIDGKGQISLMKKVGSPTRVCKELGVERWGGRRFIGQVRWATYGAVTDLNSQPHHVSCKIELVGAHNGNVSNTDSLKPWLGERGHKVVSENDGEIVVHLVEERYAANRAAPEAPLAAARRAFAAGGPELGAEPPAELLLLIASAREADALAEGSYAAAVADPRLPGVVAMKSGSSLYAGLGRDARGEFVVVSSDLSSVLMKTRYLIPLAEGEGLHFTHDDYLVFSLREPREARPPLRRSRLNVADTALSPPFRFFMEQEIAAGRFRRDLFHRLNTSSIILPPLRERRADIELLSYYFLDKHCSANGKNIRTISEPAMQLLHDHAFPGNVRELENVIAGAIVIETGDSLGVESLPAELRKAAESHDAFGPIPAGKTLLDVEADYIRTVLRQTDGNRTWAARILGISRVGLIAKLKRLGIDIEPGAAHRAAQTERDPT